MAIAPTPAKIYRALVANESGIHVVDAIEHAGEFWLAPAWLDYKDQGVSKPARIIRLARLPHQVQIGSPMADFVVNIVIPTAVLDGLSPSAEPLVEVVEAPEIQFSFVQH